MQQAFAIRRPLMFLDCRAVSAPCGFTAAGLPVGLWMVGAPLAV